jgi:uncharacterized protein DUF2247
MTPDDHALVRFEIPADFVTARLLPTAQALADGSLHGWLRRPDVVAVALAKYGAGVALAPAEEELALLLSDDLDRVDDLVADLAVGYEAEEERARVWLLLALAWTLEQRGSADEVLDVVELLYADFDHPDELAPFVRYMPAAGPPSDAAGLPQRLRRFVADGLAECRRRSAARMANPTPPPAS